MRLIDIHVKTEPAFTFLYAEETCAYNEVASKGQAMMDGLQDFVQQTFIEILGEALWAYVPAGEERLTLRAGFPIKAGTKVVKPFRVADMPEWKCLSALYKGSMDRVTDAWAELFAEVEKRGLHAAQETREIYRSWVDFDSPDNLTELQVRLK